MHTPEDSQLGREVDYPRHYDPALLFPIPRTQGRDELGIRADALPFIGHDRWQGYELGWLDARGKPVVATATFEVPATSPNLVESKSFKLYLNSFNAHRIESPEELQRILERDLANVAGAPVRMRFGVPPLREEDGGECIDGLDIAIDHYGPPDPALLICAGADVEEALVSHLLKSNCPVTGQPDWATLQIRYLGPRIDRAGLLRYIVGFRDQREFHEQCVERIFVDVLARCRPQVLSVEARYTRRGGLDINPWRATPGSEPPEVWRTPRQ
ncbi:NADPH-dependent 7-cyano-7-deazaguanine reductase QueF [Solilutibacter silvestris]|uniref:NADPH-dependent 7-cyano-7-deazaguanine reductase n=1 Tax=Solilutibacter silvestris TaxID=1645665 RepID=A0A2K1Q1A2_9GAMM|nr:NADPH-dependent 7-cyano-7-deazaguanine reductase QueF [Lysobacter silvestris]PNS08828.1 QueF: queuine synthase [Lysobacter silvestris]